MAKTLIQTKATSRTVVRRRVYRSCAVEYHNAIQNALFVYRTHTLVVIMTLDCILSVNTASAQGI